MKKFPLFIIGFLLLMRLLEPLTSPAINNSDGGFSRYEEFYSLEKNSLDYLCLGTSLSYIDVNPIQIYAYTGYRGYTLSSPAQSMQISYYWLKEALKRQKPQYVFLEVGSLIYAEDQLYENFWTANLLQMHFSPLKIEAILNCSTSTEMKNSLIFPLYRFHSRWNQLSKADFQFSDEQNNFKGSRTRFDVLNYTVKPSINSEDGTNYYLESGDLQRESTAFSISEKNRKYFDKIVQLCDQNNIVLVPMKLPTKNWDSNRETIVLDFLTQNGLEYLNLYENEILNICWDMDTYDSGYHLNHYGMTKVSYYLSEFLNCHLDRSKQKSSTELIDLWNRDLAEYLKWEQESKISNSIEPYRYLNSLLLKKEDNIIVISVKDEACLSWNPILEAYFSHLGLDGNIYHNAQSSFIGVIDGGKVLLDTWEENKMSLSMTFEDNNQSHELEVISGGWPYGLISSIKLDETEYSLNNRGLNIVVISKENGDVVSSCSIDTYDPKLTLKEKDLVEDKNQLDDFFNEADCLLKNGIYTVSWPSEIDNFLEIELIYVGDGCYMLRDVYSDKYLSIASGGSVPGSLVDYEDYTGLTNQKWFLFQNINQTYSFLSLYNSLALNFSKNHESNIDTHVYEPNYSMEQQFFLKCKSPIESSGSITAP